MFQKEIPNISLPMDHDFVTKDEDIDIQISQVVLGVKLLFSFFLPIISYTTSHNSRNMDHLILLRRTDIILLDLLPAV